LVIGAGIAGPVVAMALQRVGIAATVYEAYETPADGLGGTIGLATNGLDALRALGAHAVVTAAGFPTPRVATWLGSGRRVGGWDAGAPLADGTVTVTVRRGDLYAALRAEALRRGIPVEPGKRLVDAGCERGRVVAGFADGSEAAGGVLIGADGMRSRTRQLVDPAAPAPSYAGLLGTGGVTATDLPSTPDTLNLVFGRRAFFGYTVRPDGTVCWFANLRRRREPSPDELAEIARSGWRERLADLLARDATPAADIVRAAADELVLWPMYCMDPPARWHRGRMVLIGDAAHVSSPTSAQGAALAIEDAVVLAGCLRAGADPPAAFAAYQRRRQARVERVIANARRVNRAKTAGPLRRIARDARMRLAPARPEAYAWVYDHRVDLDGPSKD
jgi:FAD-dependent urate hydroxylase